MPDTYESLRVFLSSPGDVKAERRLAKKIIDAVSTTTRETLGIALEVKQWEEEPPKTPGIPRVKIQDKLNELVRSCHVFVLILHRRYGSKSQGARRSHLEQEVNAGLLTHAPRFMQPSAHGSAGKRRVGLAPWSVSIAAPVKALHTL